MDSAMHSVVTPSKSRLVRSVVKVLHFQAATGDRVHEPLRKDADDPSSGDEEAFLSKLFAGISAVKAAYAEMQSAQSPYNGDGIQSADKVVISELKSLSELKQFYLKKQLNEMMSPSKTLLLSEIQEQKSSLKIYKITKKKLDSQLELKNSEIIFLKEKLAEANKRNKSLEKKLNSSRQFVIPDSIQLSNIRQGHFVFHYQQMMKSIHSFVSLLITEMESADWDLNAAASSIQPGISFRKPSHKSFAFESFISKQMLDGFNCPDFSAQKLKPERDKHRSLFFDRFMELKSVKAADHLAWKPNSPFATFCRAKYLKLVHPKMESSLFGNLEQRNSVVSGHLPETPFFSAFSEMAKCVWLLHCLALSFDPEISIFEVSKGTRFSEVYMDGLIDEALLLTRADGEADPWVAFTVVPGFLIGQTVLQCQVYLF